MRILTSFGPPSAALTLALLTLAASAPARAAESGVSRTDLPPETPDQPYIHVPRDAQPRSPATRFTTGSSFFAVQVNVDGSGQNIVGDAANEPSIAVDPTNPDRIVIGWRQFDTIASNFRQAGYGFTTDGGLTWTFPGVIEPGIFRSDPVLDTDSDGTIHYNSLTLDGNDYLCDVFRADDAAITWDAGTPAHGGDKQWMTIDRSGTVGNGHVYAAWNSFFSSCPPGFFTRSLNGTSYESCITAPDDPYWGTLAVGPGGELYLCGTNGSSFTVDRSSNAKLGLGGPPITWDMNTTVSLGGSIDNGTGPNPGGLLGQTWVATRPDAVAGVPWVYLLCSVNPAGSDPLDVRFSRSTDGGFTWSPSVRINDDASTSNWQWFGTMSVAPSGRIDAIWLDTRDGPGTYDSSLYYSYSSDDGLTWSANERLSGSFNPHLGWPQQNKMGDYFHMVSDDAGFRLAWAATFNGEQDVYFGRKLLTPTAVEELQPASVALLQSHPNPFDRTSTIRYQVPRDAFVTLTVYDALGRRVATLVSGDRSAGSYRAEFDARDLPAGMYFYRLDAGDYRATEKVLRLK